jgi:hypothetical protein
MQIMVSQTKMVAADETINTSIATSSEGEYSMSMSMSMHKDISSRSSISILLSTGRPVDEDVDTLIAKDMTKLSMEERDQVLHDVHGVSDDVEETPALIEESLAQLIQELEMIKAKEAFDLARSQNLQYVDNSTFRLQFLRTDLFHVGKAASRLVLHFQVKLQLFGPEKLTKDITQDDLEDGDMKNLYSGHSQILPLRDRAGRCISVWVPPPVTLEPGLSVEGARVLCDPVIFISRVGALFR